MWTLNLPKFFGLCNCDGPVSSGRNCPTFSSSPTVADRPILWKFLPARCCNRSRASRELDTALICRKLMNFVNNNPPDAFQVLTHPLSWQDGLEGFWGCDKHFRWRFGLHGPCTGWRVSVPHLHLDVQVLFQSVESPHDVAVQRSEWGHVEN